MVRSQSAEVLDLIGDTMEALNVLFTLLNNEEVIDSIPRSVFEASSRVLEAGCREVDGYFSGGWAES